MSNLENKITSKYTHVFWVKNYIKTVTASTLIGTGIGLVVTGELTRMHNHGWSDAEIILGATCVILAFIITFLLDMYTARKDREMMRDVDNYIDERAEYIAEELVLKHLENIECDKK